ncbi:MAG: hypothetical protein KY450_14295, partial [Actinobacteria bacterium]|nr:hypothetical protein [Actinomycetota bacterium]
MSPGGSLVGLVGHDLGVGPGALVGLDLSAQALVDLLHGDHGMCQVDEPEAFESAISEPPGGVDHLARGLGRGLHGTLAQQHVSGAEPQPSVLSAFLDVFEQPRRAGHPAAGDRVVGALPVHVGEL